MSHNVDDYISSLVVVSETQYSSKFRLKCWIHMDPGIQIENIFFLANDKMPDRFLTLL